MDILPWHFRTFRSFGLYYQDPKQLWPLKLFYKLVIVSLSIHFMIFMFIALLLTSHQGIQAFADGLCLTFTIMAASFKLVIFMLHCEKIDDLLALFRLDFCTAKNDTEIIIFNKYQWKAKQSFLIRMTTTVGCSFCFLVAGIVNNINNHNWELPYNAYQMFNISGGVPYVFAYGSQITTIMCISCIDVTIDSTAWAFIILICCQLELLSHRIKSKLMNNVSIEYCVKHHNLIFRMVHIVQSCFINIIVPSFFSATFTLCSSIFQLAQKNNDFSRSVALVMFITCLLIQLYYFCWFGNELHLKNETVTKAIFESQWVTLRPLDQKNCCFIMFMGQRKLVISYHGLCTLNVRSFTWMLETTYAAFNLLQRFSV